jgi:hypothetical protein
MQLQFNAATVDPSQGAEAWPLADYPLEITSEEIVPFGENDPNGTVLKLTLTCLDGPFKGKTHGYRLNLFVTDQEWQRIAYQKLSALCHAIGRIQIADTSNLIGGRFIGVIGPQKKNPQYSDVLRVKDMNGNEPGKHNATATQAGPQLVPAYGQPGPTPTQQAPAAPAGGWQSPVAANAPPPPPAAPAPPPPPSPPPPPPPPVDPSASWQRSPDGNYKLNPTTNGWEPANAPAPPPPPPAAQQGWAPPAGQPTQAAQQPAAQQPATWQPNTDPNAGAAAPPWGQPQAK